jgi:predicted permease
MVLMMPRPEHLVTRDYRLKNVIRDLRFGLRLLARNPVFTASAVLLLAVGISANTLIFSLVNALLLAPLPVLHPENLVRIVEMHPKNFVTWDLPYGVCDAARERVPDFAEVICQGEADLAFSHDGHTGRARVHLVSPNFFSSLGVSPYLGRNLSRADDRTKAPVAVLSYAFWQREFAGERRVIGRSLELAGHSFTIIGISPEQFNALAADTSPDLRVPASVEKLVLSQESEPRPLYAQIFARLRAGVSLAQASARVEPLLHPAYQEGLSRIFHELKGNARAGASRLQLESVTNGVSTLRTQFSRALKLLMGGVALLLLMTCANVAGLLLARSAARANEMGIRRALGASAGRIIRQLLTEGLLLAFAGGVAGVLLTFACLPLLMRALPPIRDRSAVLQPLAMHVSIDGRVLGFALAVTLISAVLFALSPALQSARAEARATARRTFGRDLIVAIQVAICTVILIAATLLVRTLERMRSMNPGFDRDRVVTFTLDPSLRGYKPDQMRAFSKALLERTKQLSGVSAAGMSSRPLMRGTGLKATLGVAGQHLGPGDFLNSSMNSVTPDYFDTLGIRVLAGRGFTWFDHGTRLPRPVIVNETFARHFFPGKNPLGERFGMPGASGVAGDQDQVVGVVSDAKYRSLRESVPPTVYSPAADGFTSDFVLYVRTRVRPAGIVEPVRKLVHSLDAGMPVIEVHTLEAEVEASLWQERLLAVLGVILAAMAALLASIGLYGTLDYAVRSRTREIGVRMAVGAQAGSIVALFSRRALWLVTGGIALGLCSYAMTAAWLSRVLYGVKAWDAAVIVCVVLGILALAALAMVPAEWRALQVEPAAALRAE